VQPAEVLTEGQVLLSTVLVLATGAGSMALRLGLVRRWYWAALRGAVQLSLVGLVLGWIFRENRAIWVVLALAAMLVTATQTVLARNPTKGRGLWWDSLLSLFLGTTTTGAVTVLAVMRPDPWFTPQITLPLAGMLLGNSLTGVSLGIERIFTELRSREDRILLLLSCGATRWEAAHEPLRAAMTTAMTPVLNAMAVAGVVSLPGMMTGQLLAGADPSQAIRYQIVILFSISSTTFITTLVVALLQLRKAFSRRHQFLGVT
jgi:putative ABC transport system permease protein